MNNLSIRIFILLFLYTIVFSLKAQYNEEHLLVDTVNDSKRYISSMRSDNVNTSVITQHNVELTSYIPSPESYSIMQYSEFPVSLYNGTADISIPIYTIENGDWQLPIYLQYNTSGIKVAQEASRVGLGWSLHAGGVISRVIRDWDDFIWGFNQPSAECGPDEFDGEPDVFYYHFGTFSGKFYAKRDDGELLTSNTTFIYSTPEDNLRVQYKGNDVFHIITSDNTKYIFSVVEIHQTHSVVGETDRKEWVIDDVAVPSEAAVGMVSYCSDDYKPVGLSQYTRRTMSWYLKKIEYPTGENIIFNYNTLNNSYMSPVRLNYTKYSHLSDNIYEDLTWHTGSSSLINFYPKPTTTVNMEIIYKQPELTSIQWKNGELRFLSNNVTRKDIRPYHRTDNGTVNTAHPLEKIQLVNKSNDVIQTYQLYQSYFSGMNGAHLTDSVSYLNARLKLDSISVQGTGNKKLWYKMGYDKSDCLPKKNTLYTDRWGYYTGEKSSIIPFDPFIALQPVYDYKRICYMFEDENPTVAFPGMREDTTRVLVNKNEEKIMRTPVPESSDAAKTWSLTELITPTGGKTEYIYECNRISSQRTKWQNTDSIPAFSFTKDYWDDNRYDKLIQRDTIVYCPYNCGCVEVDCLYDGGSMLYETNTPIISISGSTLSQTGIPSGLPNTGNLAHEQYAFTIRGFFDSAGYKIITLRQDSADFARLKTTIRFYEGDYYEEPLKVGGIRVKKVKSPISTTRYRYKNETGEESGRITRNATSSYIYRNLLYSAGLVQIALMNDIAFSTSSRQPLENPYTGNFMGYSSVYAEKEDSAGLHVDHYVFKNDVEPTVGVMEAGSSVPLNGKLLLHKTYSNGDVVFEEDYEYLSEKIDSIIGNNGKKLGYIHTYPTYSCFNKLIQKNTWEYGIAPTNGQSPVGRTETYFYHPQIFLPNKILKLFGGQHETRHEIKYSIDFPTYQNGWFNSHSLNCIPVEEFFYRDNVLNKRLLHLHNKAKYPQLWREYIFNDTIPAFSGDASISYGPPDAAYAYVNGRLTRILDRGNQSDIVVWGYKNQYPIAFIHNASYSDMSNAGISLNAIANKQEPSVEDWQLLYFLQSQLPNSEVTICEYEPLVGMVKMTAPDGQVTRYSYDEFLRLRDVIEEYNGQEYLRERYEYKYSSESE